MMNTTSKQTTVRGTFRLKTVILTLAVLLVALAGFVLLMNSSKSSIPNVTLPVPNGYVEIVKAGGLITGSVPTDPEQFRSFIATNQEALRLLRQGLSHQSRVPIEYTQTYITTHLPELSNLKRLAQTLKLEGTIAESDGRFGDATKSYLDTMRLGHVAGHGGLLIDSLVGLACESIGLTPLRALTSKLEAKPCLDLIQVLEQLDLQRDSVQETLRIEKTWGQRAYGWRSLMLTIFGRNSMRPAQQKFEQKVQTHQTTLREFLIELASRAYELEQGRRPNALADLTPKYLKSIPLDPSTGTPMNYRP